MSHSNIYEAMNAVMQEVGYVQKQRGKNVSYTYAGEAALIAALRPAMVEHGIVMYPHRFNRIEREEYETSKGTRMTSTLVEIVYKLVHAPTGTEIEVTTVGEGADVSDKAAPKASTGAYKYALRQAFIIETGNDPDDFQPDPRSVQQPAPAKKNGAPPAETKKPAARKVANAKGEDTGKPFNFIEWALANDVAENEYAAKNIFAGLNLGSKPISEWKELALDYRAFREGGMKAEFAFEHVNTGNKPGKEN